MAEDHLAALDAATSLRDLSPLRSVGLHKLTGDRKGRWAMTVNGPWRILLSVQGRRPPGDVANVDCHRG